MAAGTVVHATIAVAAAPSVSVVIYATAVRSVCVHVFPQFGASCNYMMLRTHSSHFHRRRTNTIGTMLSCFNDIASNLLRFSLYSLVNSYRVHVRKAFCPPGRIP